MADKTGFIDYLRKIRLIKSASNIIVRLDFITANVIADDDKILCECFERALSTTPKIIKSINVFDFDRAVYALALHEIIMSCQFDFFDPLLLLADLQLQYTSYLTSTSDSPDSVSFMPPDWLSRLSASEQRLLKTQCGRDYFEILTRYKCFISYSE